MSKNSDMKKLIVEYEESIKKLESNIEKLREKLINIFGQDRLNLRKEIKIKESMILDLQLSVMNMRQYLTDD